SVMGGEQAAGVLTTVKRDQLARDGKTLSAEDEAAILGPILEKYEQEGSPSSSTARLWDDGILDPAETRQALALGLSAAYNAPIPDARLCVFRLYTACRCSLPPTVPSSASRSTGPRCATPSTRS